MIRRLVTSLMLVVGAFAFQAATATQAHAIISCINANDDGPYFTPLNTPIDITDVQVLANDNTGLCDFNHDDIFVNNWTDPSNGTLTHPGDTFTYTPNTGFVGTDSFTYTACVEFDSPEFGKADETTDETEGEGGGGDDKICDTATVTIDPQAPATTTTVTVLGTTITAPTTTVTVLAAQLAATGADTSATLPIGGLLTGTGALFVGGAAMARRRLKVRKYKKS